jgi:hypothetical protein
MYITDIASLAKEPNCPRRIGGATHSLQKHESNIVARACVVPDRADAPQHGPRALFVLRDSSAKTKGVGHVEACSLIAGITGSLPLLQIERRTGGDRCERSYEESDESSHTH